MALIKSQNRSTFALDRGVGFNKFYFAWDSSVSVELENITKLKNDSVVNQITDLTMENKRILTPIGRDTIKLIVKTLILPTLNH